MRNNLAATEARADDAEAKAIATASKLAAGVRSVAEAEKHADAAAAATMDVAVAAALRDSPVAEDGCVGGRAVAVAAAVAADEGGTTKHAQASRGGGEGRHASQLGGAKGAQAAEGPTTAPPLPRNQRAAAAAAARGGKDGKAASKGGRTDVDIKADVDGHMTSKTPYATTPYISEAEAVRPGPPPSTGGAPEREQQRG